MVILIDYYNLDNFERKSSIYSIVDKIIRIIGPNYLLSPPRARVKIYGAWYRNRKPTKTAQTLLADIQSAFPTNIKLLYDEKPINIKVVVELAYALEISPAKHFLNTLRNYNVTSVKFKKPEEVGSISQQVIYCFLH